jgi:hypothetical protein
MKQIILLFFISCGLVQSNQCTAQSSKKPGNSLAGVFDGRTPCQELAKQLHETVTPACIKIKWRLTLYKDSVTGDPGTYELLGFVYKKDTPRTGKWSISKGTKVNPQAIIYQLDQPGREPLLLLKADDNVLFFLDQEKNLLVGNRDFSYTLNRLNKNP